MKLRKRRSEEIAELEGELNFAGIPYTKEETVRKMPSGEERAELTWVYTGDSLREAADFALLVMVHKEAFYCHESRRVERARLIKPESSMLDLLRAMVKTGKRSFQYPADFPKTNDQARGFSTNYADLVHFGLLRKEPGTGKKPIYTVTDHGVAFVNRLAPTFQWVLVKNAKTLKYGPKNYFCRKAV